MSTFWNITLSILDRNHFNSSVGVHACVYIVYTCTYSEYYALAYVEKVHVNHICKYAYTE